MAGAAAIGAAVREFRFIMTGAPNQQIQNLYEQRVQNYNLGWAAYKNTLFDDLARLQIEAKKSGLYIKTKGLCNPVSRLVKFYEYHVYPGGLSADGTPPKEQRDAMPLPVDLDPRLKLAIAQCWQWGNWQNNMRQYVKFGAAMGDVFCEIVDDAARGQVYAQVLHPALVTDAQFDDARPNVLTSYTTERVLYDRERGRSYTFKRVIDSNGFAPSTTMSCSHSMALRRKSKTRMASCRAS